MSAAVFLFSMISLLLSAVLAVPADIVGGTPATETFPWMASLQYDGQHICGGSWINRNTILTAGHCSDPNETDFSSYTVETNRFDLGISAKEERGYVFKVTKQIVHPKYVLNTDENEVVIVYDVALWKVTPVKKIAKLPEFPALDDGTYDVPDTLLTVMGWGDTAAGGEASNILLQVDVPVTTDKFCKTAYPNVGPTNFCAGFKKGGKDACQGDSGGPIYKQVDGQYVIVGTVSSGEGCAVKGYPGLYCRLSNPEISEFIQQNL